MQYWFQNHLWQFFRELHAMRSAKIEGGSISRRRIAFFFSPFNIPEDCWIKLSSFDAKSPVENLLIPCLIEWPSHSMKVFPKLLFDTLNNVSWTYQYRPKNIWRLFVLFTLPSYLSYLTIFRKSSCVRIVLALVSPFICDHLIDVCYSKVLSQSIFFNKILMIKCFLFLHVFLHCIACMQIDKIIYKI